MAHTRRRRTRGSDLRLVAEDLVEELIGLRRRADAHGLADLPPEVVETVEAKIEI